MLQDRGDQGWDEAEVKRWLGGEFLCPVYYDEPMNRHTSFGVGGAADMYIEPEEREELRLLIEGLDQRRIPFMVIGGGTNLLVLDGGIRGVVINLRRLCKGTSWDKGVDRKVLLEAAGGGEFKLEVPAGIKLRWLCAYTLAEGLEGFNRVIGIPGSVGGAVYMNAGTGAGSIADVLESVTVMDVRGEIRTYRGKGIRGDYRRLSVNDGGVAVDLQQVVIVSVGLRVTKGDSAVLKSQARKLLRERKSSQPIGRGSAGCIFKNPGNPSPAAGKLIELSALKGKKIGGAVISPKHANFIVNEGKALAADILELISLIRETVLNQHHILLETEVQIVGEQTYKKK